MTSVELELPTVVLIGSIRHPEAFLAAGESEALAGYIVLGPWSYVPGAALSAATLKRLQLAHECMIRMADEVLVVTVGGYIGEHTRREIAYARKRGKPVRQFDLQATPVIAPYPPEGGADRG